MKKLKLRSLSISSIEKKKYSKLLDGWKVFSPLKKRLFFWIVELEKTKK
jgi:hypothetical protein